MPSAPQPPPCARRPRLARGRLAGCRVSAVRGRCAACSGAFAARCSCARRCQARHCPQACQAPCHPAHRPRQQGVHGPQGAQQAHARYLAAWQKEVCKEIGLGLLCVRAVRVFLGLLCVRAVRVFFFLGFQYTLRPKSSCHTCNKVAMPGKKFNCVYITASDSARGRMLAARNKQPL